MRDGQYRLLWTGISDSKKMKAVTGDPPFRRGCHLVYSWLLPWCDDEGRMPGEPLKILANVVPNEDLSLKEIEKILAELQRVGLLAWYQVDEERFIQIFDWEKYQHIRKDRKKSSIYPECQPNDNQMTTKCPQSDDLSLSLSLSPSPSPSPSLSVNLTTNWLTDGFQKFWTSYPKKKSKGDAEKVWKKIKPNEALFKKVMETLNKLKVSEDWTKESGKYIPHPATWLNAKGWEDEVSENGAIKKSDTPPLDPDERKLWEAEKRLRPDRNKTDPESS